MRVAAIAMLVALAALAGWIGVQGRLALRAADARPLRPGESPRLVSLVRGVSSDLGVSMPGLWVVDTEVANAFVCNALGPSVAIARPLLETFSRTELEAVVAHCLVRIMRRRPRTLQARIALGLVERSSRDHTAEDDAQTALVTRYPPGLAAAIRKCDPARGRFAPLYFVADVPSVAAPEQRARELLDL